MSTLRVNKLVNQLDSAGPQFSDGVTISNGITGDITYNSAGGTITAGSLSSGFSTIAAGAVFSFG